MIYAEQGNKVLQISEQNIQRYAELGYTIIDERGNVIKETVPTDLATLKLAYKEHIEKIKSLEAKVAELEQQLKAKKVEQPIEEQTKVEVSEQPKPRGRKTTKVEE